MRSATASRSAGPGLFGAARILRGENAEVVGRVSGFGGSNLRKLLAGSDSAVMHARRYTNASRASSIIGIVGAGLAFAAFRTLDDDNTNYGSASALIIASAAVGITAGGFQLRAQRELSRAVWWYNRDVSRSAPQ